MLERRTDLAMEARELLEQEGHSLPGIESHEEEAEGFPLTTVRRAPRPWASRRGSTTPWTLRGFPAGRKRPFPGR